MATKTIPVAPKVSSQRMLPYAVVHFGAHRLQQLALEVLDCGESPERVSQLLALSRELTDVIERRLAGRTSLAAENVVDLASRKVRQRHQEAV